MKTKITALALVAVTALAFTPKPAAAGDKGLAAIGGFIGGLIIGSAISDSHRHDAYPEHETTIIINDRGDRCDDGYWESVTTKVWVPGVWIVERRHHGISYRRYIGGHYEYRTDRVWVPYDRHDGYPDYYVSRNYGRR